jgi:hypothetical protein
MFDTTINTISVHISTPNFWGRYVIYHNSLSILHSRSNTLLPLICYPFHHHCIILSQSMSSPVTLHVIITNINSARVACHFLGMESRGRIRTVDTLKIRNALFVCIHIEVTYSRRGNAPWSLHTQPLTLTLR